MEENSIVKEIKGKGNGQAIIYVNKIDLKKNGWNIGDHVRVKKVDRKVIIKDIN